MELSDDLTNSQIALLCDIGEFKPSKPTSDQKDLERLISGGYVQPTEDHPNTRSAFMLTAKALEFLGRAVQCSCVGLTESDLPHCKGERTD
jgi:hypothetical protein